jgi:hypothetical protein
MSQTLGLATLHFMTSSLHSGLFVGPRGGSYRGGRDSGFEKRESISAGRAWRP